MIANKISSPTFRHLKVNEYEIDENKLSFDIKPWDNIKDTLQDVSLLDEKFSNVEFGINKEILENIIKNPNSKNYINSSDKTSVLNYEIPYEFTKEHNALTDITKIQANEGTNTKVTLSYINDNKDKATRNSLLYIYAMNNSVVDVYIISGHNSSDHITQSVGVITEENATVNIYHIDLGGDFQALNIQNFLQGKNSTVNVNGAYFLKNSETLDLLYDSKIFGKNCNTNIKILGAQKDNSQKTFKGTIDFKRGSSGSVGDESETVTLLSENVVSRSLPILLCGEEDVVGSHAASAGKINEEKLFYIMSRGYSEKEAIALLVTANLFTVIDKVQNEQLVEKLKKYILENL